MVERTAEVEWKGSVAVRNGFMRLGSGAWRWLHWRPPREVQMRLGVT